MIYGDYKTKHDRLGLNPEQKIRLQVLAIDVIAIVTVLGLIMYIAPDIIRLIEGV